MKFDDKQEKSNIFNIGFFFLMFKLFYLFLKRDMSFVCKQAVNLLSINCLSELFNCLYVDNSTVSFYIHKCEFNFKFTFIKFKVS